MVNFLVRLFVTAASMAVAAFLVSGIHVQPDLQGFLMLGVVALFFGLVNAIIKPITLIVTCLINVLTLGLFTLVINALMLMLTSWLVSLMGLGRWFSVDGFWAAFFGAIIISIVSAVLSIFLPEKE